jgi:ABC-2 type transport system ATP-binding protein
LRKVIVAENLRKSYDQVVAVDGISFRIEQGETFGLLGPNGAGKTTTINMLLGVLKPDRGTVQIDGALDPTRPELRRKLGSAPQAIALYGDLTGEENLRLFGQLYGLSGAFLKERVNWALAFAGLTDRRRSLVATYSGGMQRRLNMVCALLHNPPVILFDEPTVGVDPQSRMLIFDSIEKLKKEGRTILYTTHYIEEAQRLCDRVAIIDHGKILDLDTVDNLIRKHSGPSSLQIELDSPPTAPAPLPCELNGAVLTVKTTEPVQALAELFRHYPNIVRATIDRADLESVFLNLTGRRLRD